MAAVSALVILAPEAEALVAPFRDKHDPSAAVGMPAHITLLFPFMAPTAIDSSILVSLRDCFSRFVPFDYSLTCVESFATDVLYLQPTPYEPFRAMTLAIWQRFPDCPPYEGRHKEVVPHLSIAQTQSFEEISRIRTNFAAASAGSFPIRLHVAHAALMDNATGRWRIREMCALGAGA